MIPSDLFLRMWCGCMITSARKGRNLDVGGHGVEPGGIPRRADQASPWHRGGIRQSATPAASTGYCDVIGTMAMNRKFSSIRTSYRGRVSSHWCDLETGVGDAQVQPVCLIPARLWPDGHNRVSYSAERYQNDPLDHPGVRALFRNPRQWCRPMPAPVGSSKEGIIRRLHNRKLIPSIPAWAIWFMRDLLHSSEVVTLPPRSSPYPSIDH